MRDPNRIDKFCDELKTIWHKVPDWRFGQFIMNLFTDYKLKHSAVEWFYAEDDELMNSLKEYFKEQENA